MNCFVLSFVLVFSLSTVVESVPGGMTGVGGVYKYNGDEPDYMAVARRAGEFQRESQFVIHIT